jgi:4-(2-carboxyphenyl)-2-oxobut-3-enoate aldolase
MASLPRVTPADLHGVIGYLLTPTLDGIDRNTSNGINVAESARAANALIHDGVTALCLNGTFGEVASLNWDELQTFTSTVIEAAARRVPVFAGATTMNTRDTIARARAFRDMGASGLMLGRPMMSAMSDKNTVDFYADVAAEVPELAIIVYDDMEAFKRPITTTVYHEISKIPQVIAAKYRSRLLISGLVGNSYNADLDAVADRMKLLPGEFDWLFAYRFLGVETCWSSLVCGGPAPVMALRDALYASDWDEAANITREVASCYEGLIPNGNFEAWHVDKIPFMKARFAAAGYLNPGPPLPPYRDLSPARLEIAKACGRRSAELQVKYSAPALAAE